MTRKTKRQICGAFLGILIPTALMSLTVWLFYIIGPEFLFVIFGAMFLAGCAFTGANIAVEDDDGSDPL